MMEPTVEITRYRVSCVPAGHVDSHHFTLSVERRNVNPDRWAVTDGFGCFDADGHHEYESLPSSRTDEYKRDFRHGLDDALALAKRIAPGMTVNGHTVEDVLLGPLDEYRGQ